MILLPRGCGNLVVCYSHSREIFKLAVFPGVSHIGWLMVGEPSVDMTELAGLLDPHLVDESKVRLRISPMKRFDTSMTHFETDPPRCGGIRSRVSPEDIIVMASVKETFEHVPLDLNSGSRTQYLVALEKALNRLTDTRAVSTNTYAFREYVALLGAFHGYLSGENSLATVDKSIVSQMNCFSRLVEIAKFKS